MKHVLRRFAPSPSKGTPPVARHRRFHGGRQQSLQGRPSPTTVARATTLNG